MCKAFSCVVLRDGLVKWQAGVDSHDHLIGLMARDMGVDQCAIDGMYGEHFMTRIEVRPDKSYLEPDGNWHIEFDGNQQPDWWASDHRCKVDRAFGLWKKDVYSKINLFRLQAVPYVMESLRSNRIETLYHTAEVFLDDWVDGLRQFGPLCIAALELHCRQYVGNTLMSAVEGSIPNELGLDSHYAHRRERSGMGVIDSRPILEAVRQAYVVSMLMACVPAPYQKLIEAGARLVELGMVPLYNAGTGEWTLANGAGTYFAKTYAPLGELPFAGPSRQFVRSSRRSLSPEVASS